MTREQAILEMGDIALGQAHNEIAQISKTLPRKNCGDHEEADEILCKRLEALGETELVALYRTVERYFG